MTDPWDSPGWREAAEEYAVERLKAKVQRRYDTDANGEWGVGSANGAALQFDQFYAYAKTSQFIFIPTGELWPTATVNSRLPWVGGIKPSLWLHRNHPVEQMTWAPGQPALIKHKLLRNDGWIDHQDASVFNLYRPADLQLGNADNAQPWIEHVRKIYPDDPEHIIQWFAYRAQHPEVKINHALVLGGAPGIGKDTLLAPLRVAIGYGNWATVSPQIVLGRFNPFLKSVVLVISEARDLGDVNRPQFFEHLKAIIAAPPDVLLIDEKNTHEYYVPNLVGIIITTNHKVGGIYLTAEDRRHFVAWSNTTLDDFPAGYFNQIWQWYDQGGLEDVAAYLMTRDLSGFDPKAPPPKTQAFWEIVTASEAPESGELDDILTKLGYPAIITLDQLTGIDCDPDLAKHLKDRRNRRMIPRWLEAVGYRVVRNPDNKQGLWRLNGKKQIVYARSSTPWQDVIAAVRATRH
jgi:hypothetical protein